VSRDWPGIDKWILTSASLRSSVIDFQEYVVTDRIPLSSRVIQTTRMKMEVPKWLEKRSPELNVWLTVLVDNGNILMLFSFSDFWADVVELKNVPCITYHGRKITAVFFILLLSTICSIFCVLSYQL
jgi:hypothetical protein